MEQLKEFQDSIYTGLVDKSHNSSELYQPKLLKNDFKKGQKVLTSLLKELRNCEEFFFSVAFITESGVTILLDALKELEDRNVKGKIIASQYLNFTNPKALERLMQFSNIDLRIVVDGNHHAKGYIFKRKHVYNLIVGSSNLTQDALGYNKEWNLKISSLYNGAIIDETLNEFNGIFSNAVQVTPEWISSYREIYEAERLSIEKNFKIDRVASPPIYKTNSENKIIQLNKIMPNKMQINALIGIQQIRDLGETKALLVSATGTGKTYLAAFDVKRLKPKRLLFLAHREQLLNQSIESFEKVIDETINCGKMTGSYHDVSAQYIFSTVQMMSKEKTLALFSKHEFDYIIIDESHRIGADSYQRILNYFEPDFLLGMTATPERSDDHNICADFDYNIAYEIRLQEAMQENMLCPFHYFGISEITINGALIDEETDFRYLTSDERVKNIIEKIEFYGYEGDRVKGLVFCSRNSEAKELSDKFNKLGYNTVALSGSDSQNLREEMIERLESDIGYDRLDYIFTVDIFNEGVDIPCVNQVVMLRPTQSVIIFVQQLGRGLRKIQGKEYVVVLDFIGNYKNNFMIPMALSDDRSFNKDTIRRYTTEGSRIIPGCSTINFDEIARKRIYEAIDTVNFKSVKYMKESYKDLKYRLGRIPKLMDFEYHDSMDLAVLFNGNIGSYHEFLLKYEDEYNVTFDDIKTEIIRFISKKLATGKRPHELIVIKQILNGSDYPLDDMVTILEGKYSIIVQEKTLINVRNVLTNQFLTGVAKNTFVNCIFLDDDKPSAEFLKLIEDKQFKCVLEELVDYGLFRNTKYYGTRYKATALSLYQKYSYEDVCRILEWEKSEVSLNIGGYKYDKSSATYPVFINYHKEDDIESSIKYEDRFLSHNKLVAISKSGRSITSNDVQIALKAKEKGIDMELFVRKNKDDKTSKEFYYLGRIFATGELNEIVMEEANKGAVEISYSLETAVREDIYDYITEG